MALGALALAGCGGDDTTATGTTTTTTTTTTGAGGAGGSGGATSSGGGGGTAGGGGQAVDPGVPYVYVGRGDDSIATFLLDRQTGTLTPQSQIDAGSGPSFLAADPSHRHLYAVNEGSGDVAAFAIDANGALAGLGQVSSAGSGPAYVSVDATGAWVLVANYGGGTVAVLPVQGDGSLGDAVDVESPGVNPHLIRTNAKNDLAFVPCKGSDRVAQYQFDDKTGKLAESTPASVDTAPGAGPRHLEFHPTLPMVYVINEMGDSVVVYDLDQASGTLSPIQTVPTLPDGVDGTDNYCADLHITPDGKFLYGSNRGNDSLVVYSVTVEGTLIAIGYPSTGGSWPRNFGLDPNSDIVLVANQMSDNVVTFRRDQATGALTQLVTNDVGPGPAWVGVVTQPTP